MIIVIAFNFQPYLNCVACVVTVKFLPTRKGVNPLLMFKRYTYKLRFSNLKGGVLWYCSNRHSGCKAIVNSVNNVYTTGEVEHNHPPPIYHQLTNGKWIKIMPQYNPLRDFIFQDDSDEKASSGSECEDNLFQDPTYETDTDDEISSMNLKSLSNEEDGSHTFPSINTSIETSDTIMKLSRNTLHGKDNHKWLTKRPPQTQRSRDKITAEPVEACKNEVDPFNCFSFFITDNIVETIVTHTNAEIIKKNKKYKKANATQNLTDAREIRAFIGILTLSAAMKDSHLSIKELFDVSFCGNRYRNTMSCLRFDFLKGCLKFSDFYMRNERKRTDVFAPFREMWNLFMSQCRENYKPGNFLTIDEQLLAFRGKCPFRVYSPKKPTTYGIKIVMLVDSSTKYMVDAEPYLGKFNDTDGEPLGEYYVKKLTTSIHGTNRNITMDKWYTTLPLARTLVNEPYNLTSVGALKANKQEIPIELQNHRARKVGTSMLCYDNEVTLLSYKPKSHKVTFFLSTCGGEEEINKNSKKPTVVEFYNQTRGAVESLEQMYSAISCSRKSEQWPITLFYRMLTIAFVNSYIIYKMNCLEATKHPLPMREYLKSVHYKLVEPHLQNRLTMPTLQSSLRNSIIEILPVPDRNKIPPLESQSRSDEIPVKKEKDLFFMFLQKAKND
ncbi:unnamed protein product [Colias eurytheme]|nr:unnamed protein product [Colias eurytheme]